MERMSFILGSVCAIALLAGSAPSVAEGARADLKVVRCTHYSVFVGKWHKLHDGEVVKRYTVVDSFVRPPSIHIRPDLKERIISGALKLTPDANNPNQVPFRNAAPDDVYLVDEIAFVGIDNLKILRFAVPFHLEDEPPGLYWRLCMTTVAYDIPGDHIYLLSVPFISEPLQEAFNEMLTESEAGSGLGVINSALLWAKLNLGFRHPDPVIAFTDSTDLEFAARVAKTIRVEWLVEQRNDLDRHLVAFPIADSAYWIERSLVPLSEDDSLNLGAAWSQSRALLEVRKSKDGSVAVLLPLLDTVQGEIRQFKVGYTPSGKIRSITESDEPVFVGFMIGGDIEE